MNYGYALLDPGRLGCLMKQPAQLASGYRTAGSLSAGKQPAFLPGDCRIVP